MHRHTNGAGLISHGTGDGLANPPCGVRGELEALLPVELLYGTNQTKIAFLNQIEEQHATARIALGKRDHESKVGFQQMVLGALAVVRGPLQFTPALEIHLVGFRVQQMLGVQTGLDAFGQVDFLFGVQQVHSADLLQVILDRICGGAGCDHTTLRIAGRRQIVVVIIVTHHESAFFLGLFRLFALVFVIVFQFGIVILVDIVLVEVVILPFVVHVIKVIVEIIKIGILDGIVFRSVLLDQVLFFFRFLAFLGGGGLLRGRLARRLRSGL